MWIFRIKRGPVEKEHWIGHFMFRVDSQYWFELAILHAIAVENAKTAVDVEVPLLFIIFFWECSKTIKYHGIALATDMVGNLKSDLPLVDEKNSV